MFWTRRLLESTGYGRELLAFLAAREPTYRDGATLYVHATPREPLYEYLFPEDIYNQRKMDAITAHFERLCFCGHSHIPGVFTHHPDNWEFLSPAECDNVYQFDDRKTIVNVGSVGQPRDDDPRACYVLYDGRTARFRRVDYDFETTARKIRDLPDLDDFLGDRLRHGR
jgi:diadenosine tetraphosphatase ApaH/serine/threonine PP2A family protein phosphatase